MQHIEIVQVVFMSRPSVVGDVVTGNMLRESGTDGLDGSVNSPSPAMPSLQLLMPTPSVQEQHRHFS